MLKLFIDVSEDEFYVIKFCSEGEKKDYLAGELIYCRTEVKEFANASDEEIHEVRQTLLRKRVEYARSKGKILLSNTEGTPIYGDKGVKVYNPL